MTKVRIKICGVTCVEDALAAADAGANCVGLNLVPSSKRVIDRAMARAITVAVRGRATTVAVVADLSVEVMLELRRDVGVDALQLSGDERPDALADLLPSAYKGVRMGAEPDVASARTYGGALLLADARVDGVLGGSGQTFDWALVRDLARERRLILAGGLTSENVAGAIRAVRPWGVDVASGVEEPFDPRRKSHARMEAFVASVGAALRPLE